jgi:predicted xylose isomerase-like sugar epimerase
MRLSNLGQTQNLKKQAGQSMMEYAVVCGALAFVLFYPISDVASPGEAKTTVQIVIDGFKLAYKKFSYAISIPT